MIYPVYCYRSGCGQLAEYKIAARWSDGITEELKTYALSCPACIADLYRNARQKQKQCRKAPGEILEPPGIYRLQRGQRDQALERLGDMEARLNADSVTPG
jgi:hypothetical protein